MYMSLCKKNCLFRSFAYVKLGVLAFCWFIWVSYTSWMIIFFRWLLNMFLLLCRLFLHFPLLYRNIFLIVLYCNTHLFCFCYLSFGYHTQISSPRPMSGSFLQPQSFSRYFVVSSLICNFYFELKLCIF